MDKQLIEVEKANGKKMMVNEDMIPYLHKLGLKPVEKPKRRTTKPKT